MKTTRSVARSTFLLLCGFGPALAWIDAQQVLPRPIQVLLWAVAVPGASASWISGATRQPFVYGVVVGWVNVALAYLVYLRLDPVESAALGWLAAIGTSVVAGMLYGSVLGVWIGLLSLMVARGANRSLPLYRLFDAAGYQEIRTLADARDRSGLVRAFRSTDRDVRRELVIRALGEMRDVTALVELYRDEGAPRGLLLDTLTAIPDSSLVEVALDDLLQDATVDEDIAALLSALERTVGSGSLSSFVETCTNRRALAVLLQTRWTPDKPLTGISGRARRIVDDARGERVLTMAVPKGSDSSDSAIDFYNVTGDDIELTSRRRVISGNRLPPESIGLHVPALGKAWDSSSSRERPTYTYYGVTRSGVAVSITAGPSVP